MIRQSLTIVCLALIALPASARTAEEARGDAERRYIDGIQLTKKARWNAALAEFQTARAIVEKELSAKERKRILPAILYEIGLASEHVASKAAVAVAAYERYLAEPPPNPNPKALAHAREVVAKLANTVGRARILGPEGAQVFIDKEPVGTLPFSTPILVNRGVHEVSIAGDGWLPNPLRLELIVPGGGTAELDARPFLRKPEVQRGVLVVRSLVPGFAVRIDDAPSEAVAEVEVGVHKVEVTRDGYAPRKTAARVEAGRETTVSVDLLPQEPLPAALGGQVRLKPNVEDAVVTLDGKPAPALLGEGGMLVPIGPHDITVRAASGAFDEFSGRIDVKRGDNPAIPVALLPLAPAKRAGPDAAVVGSAPGPAGPSAGPVALVVAGGAALVAGAVLAGLAFDASQDVDTLIASGAPPQEVSDREDLGRDMAIAADVLVPVGLAAAVVGLIIWD